MSSANITSSIPTATSTRKKSKGRTFQCSGYPDCNMTFTRSEHLARHIRKHTGERPFECVHCTRKFSRLDNLRQHKQTVHAHEQGNNLKYGNDDEPAGDENGAQHEIIAHTDEETSNSTLLRPTQFRPKHRPRPLALPSRNPIYNDAPYTVPTPRSAGSNHPLALSPISPSHYHIHRTQPQTANLPSFQALSHPARETWNRDGMCRNVNGEGDSLISPYGSSFTSSIHSNYSTPLNTSFDIRTPSNSTFYPEYNDAHNKKAWLNNSTNNSNSNSNNNNNNNNNNILVNVSPSFNSTPEYNPQTSSLRSSIGQVSTNNNATAHGNKKVKIESLLNSSKNNNNNNSTNGSDNSEKDERVRLPPVDTLGIR